MPTGRQKLPNGHQEATRSRAADVPVVAVAEMLFPVGRDADFDQVPLSNRAAKIILHSLKNPRVFLCNTDLQTWCAPSTSIGIARPAFALEDSRCPNNFSNAGMFDGFKALLSPSEFFGIALTWLLTTARRVVIERILSAKQVFAAHTMAPKDTATTIAKSRMSTDCERTINAAYPIFRSIRIVLGCRHGDLSSCIQNTALKTGVQYL